MRKRIGTLVAVAAVAALVVGCSSSSKTTSGSTSSGAGAASTTASGAAAGLTADQLQWALTYTGGTKGKADSSKSPVVLGYVNQQGGTLSFPEATIAENAVVKFVNEQLGGIQGHPLVIHQCLAAAPEESQKCGQQMANDADVKAIVIPLLLLNNQAFYAPIAGKKPILAGSLIFPIDLTTPNVFSYSAGGYANGKGLVNFALKTLKAKRVIILRTDNPAGLAAEQFYATQLKAAGGVAVDVPVTEPGTAPAYTAAIRSANPQPGDVIDLALTSIGAASAFDAMRTLNISPKDIPVLASAAQGLPPMPGHLKDAGLTDTVFPDQWYISNAGYTEYMPVPNSNGTDVYVGMMNQYAPGANIHGYAPQTFTETLSLVKFYNTLGPDATADQLSNAIKTFKGPAPMIAGELRCGALKATPNTCGFNIGHQQRVNGQWVSKGDGIDGGTFDTLAGS